MPVMANGFLGTSAYGADAGRNRSSDSSSSGNLVRQTPFLIGVCGGTASGKTTVCDEIIRRLGGETRRMVAMINQDSFYRELTEEEKMKAFRGDFNFDHPDAFDYDLLYDTLQNIKQGLPVSLPVYDYRTHARMKGETREIPSVDVVLVEGILVFYSERIRTMFDMKLFVDADPDTRLARRVKRDMADRGRELPHILHQYLTLVKPAYEEFCLPTKKYADVIIPRGAENIVAIDLIVQHIRELLKAPRHPATQEGPGQIRHATRHVSESYVSTLRPH